MYHHARSIITGRGPERDTRIDSPAHIIRSIPRSQVRDERERDPICVIHDVYSCVHTHPTRDDERSRPDPDLAMHAAPLACDCTVLLRANLLGQHELAGAAHGGPLVPTRVRAGRGRREGAEVVVAAAARRALGGGGCHGVPSSGGGVNWRRRTFSSGKGTSRLANSAATPSVSSGGMVWSICASRRWPSARARRWCPSAGRDRSARGRSSRRAT